MDRPIDKLPQDPPAPDYPPASDAGEPRQYDIEVCG